MALTRDKFLQVGTGAVNRDLDDKIVDMPVTPQDFGAVGDGTTDDTAAIQAALDSGAAIVYFPSGSYPASSTITVSSPVHLLGEIGSKIIPTIGLGGGKLFLFTTDDVIVENMSVDGTGETFTPSTGNTYAFFSGDGTTKYYNHSYINNKIINLSFSDGNTGLTNLLVSHGIYVDNVDDVVIDNNIIDTISGSCVFLRDNHNVSIRNNRFEDFRWYATQLTFNVKHWIIENNSYLSGTAEGCYWGGAVNIVSDIGEIKVSHGKIDNNYFTGKYSYGAVVRVQSADEVTVSNNVLDSLSLGTSAPSTQDLTGIRILTRGVSSSSKNEPCQNITIANNRLHGGTITSTGKKHGIYIDNGYWTTRNPSRSIRVYGNDILSPDTTNYWDEAIIVHGSNGGFEDVWITDNKIETYLQSSPTVGGAIGLIASSSTGLVDRVHIGGNYLEDIGTPASSYQYGIGCNAYCNNVISSSKNYIKNYFYGIRTLTNSGATLDNLDHQIFDGCTTDLLAIVAISEHLTTSDASVGGTASAGAGNQYISLTVNGINYKVLHDGTI